MTKILDEINKLKKLNKYKNQVKFSGQKFQWVSEYYTREIFFLKVEKVRVIHK